MGANNDFPFGADEDYFINILTAHIWTLKLLQNDLIHTGLGYSHPSNIQDIRKYDEALDKQISTLVRWRDNLKEGK